MNMITFLTAFKPGTVHWDENLAFGSKPFVSTTDLPIYSYQIEQFCVQAKKVLCTVK